MRLLSKGLIAMTRIRLKVRVINVFEQGITLKDEDGNLYQWFTRNYKSPLFYAVDDEWFNVSATKFIFDHPTPKNGLKNDRILKHG